MYVTEIQFGSAPPPPPPPQLTLGLDLGQPGEVVALAVAETTWTGPSASHALRHLERFLPGTPYSTMLARVAEIRGTLRPAVLVVDATSAGAPIVDRFERLGSVVKVVLTNSEASDLGLDSHRLPLRDVVGQAQLVLQEGRLRVARGLALADELTRELRSYRVKLTAATDAVAWRTGPGDDLVLAVSLALWWAEMNQPWELPAAPPSSSLFDGSFR